ncbi:MAG TPA: C45 family autoproteolytic acyltransferase/hydrolase [Anaerolineaceae bacterium]|nr:C45 family autoproteolytic acyltransferase/hydrolase [Anaerolineaceae bacterium]
MENYSKSDKPLNPPFLCVGGTHRVMGQQIGESIRLQVQHGVENTRFYFSRNFSSLQLTWESAVLQALNYLYYALQTYPQYIEEIQGIAEGANVNYADLAVVNAFECVAVDALHLQKCTSIAAGRSKTRGSVIVGHNEDWLADDEPDVYFLLARPLDEPAFIAMSYGGLLPNIGFNELGIAQSCDSVYPIDLTIGIPRVIVSRAVLAALTIEEAINRTHPPLRAAGYNHLLAHSDGELYNVEVSATEYEVIPAENGCLAHTNHYLSPKMQQFEKTRAEWKKTDLRYSRIISLLSGNESHSMQTIQSMLADHENYPHSICQHAPAADSTTSQTKTIVSLVMDLGERKMAYSLGNPCCNAYHVLDPDF